MLVAYPASGIFVLTTWTCLDILFTFFEGSSPSGLYVISSSMVRVILSMVTRFALCSQSVLGDNLIYTVMGSLGP